MSKANGKREYQMPAILAVRLHPELKQIIESDAAKTHQYGGMGELVVKILAEHYGRPDLGQVPRKRVGRPPNKLK